MKPRGRHVLYAIRDLERAEGFASYSTAGEIARMIGRKDGRAVTRTLIDLEKVGLVSRVGYVDPHWRTTQRGREVEKLCSDADVLRGGSFVPLVEVLPEFRERFAVAR